jgi:hypothetical protein
MSDYAQTDWVDNVTPVDAARMDNIEAGIESAHNEAHAAQAAADAAAAALPAKEDKSAKGAANGYAPLGADTKVPAIYLPAGGSGGAIEYENVWAGATAYQPGDVVVHNGVEYLAVNPSTGQTPPALLPLAPPPVTLVTVLPTSPFDGQTVDFTDSLTTPSWVWRLRYVAAAPTNKWKFVGGSPGSHNIQGAESTAISGSWVNLATVGPQFTVPLAGDYEVSFSCFQTKTAADTLIAAGVGVGDWTAGVIQANGSVYTVNAYAALAASGVMPSLTAGQIIRLRYYQAAVGTLTASFRSLLVRPVAVSA